MKDSHGTFALCFCGSSNYVIWLSLLWFMLLSQKMPGTGMLVLPKLIPPLESQQGFYLKELTSGDGAEWVEPLPSIHKSLGRSQHNIDPAWRYTPVTSALGKRRPENQKFKVIPGYIASSEVSPGSKTNQF